MASPLAESIRQRAEAQRVLSQETNADKFYVKKPIGTFVGQWVGFKSNGKGVVSYKGREYEVEILTSTYAKKNQSVQLSLTDDGNFANW